MQISNSNTSFKGFDYIPCIMNEEQIELAEKVYKTIAPTDTYQIADKKSIDFVAIPKGNDAIDIFMYDNHYEHDVKNNRTVVKTPFRVVEVPSAFNHKVNRLLDKMNIYLKKTYNIDAPKAKGKK